MTVKLPCVLCGAEDTDTRIGIVAWRTPIGTERYSAIPRCREREACRTRVEATGGAWEIYDPLPPGVTR